MLGVVWFVAADVCKALGLTNPSQALARLDDDERSTLTIIMRVRAARIAPLSPKPVSTA